MGEGVFVGEGVGVSVLLLPAWLSHAVSISKRYRHTNHARKLVRSIGAFIMILSVIHLVQRVNGHDVERVR